MKQTSNLRSRSSTLAVILAAVFAPVCSGFCIGIVTTPDTTSTGLLGLMAFGLVFGIARFRAAKSR